MDQTPVDGSDREGRDGRDAGRGTDTATLLDRVASRLRSVGRSLRTRLRSVTGQSDDYREFDRTAGRGDPSVTDRTRSVQCVGLTEEVVEGDGRAVTDDLIRAQAESAVDRDGPSVDPPELDVQRTEGELTLSSPDEPDAHITSTHWEDVER
ncbi:MAG: hypothetical protein ABEJ26_09050 [Halosimplex sp.]